MYINISMCDCSFSETVSTIIPLIAALSKDIEPVVKQHLVEQLRYIAKVLLSSLLYLTW